MTRLRVFLAWILLAALPLQGYAAAAMLFCGSSAGRAVTAAPHHDAHEGHGGHSHAAQASHASHEVQHESGKALADADHACSVCAACSHSVALADTPHFVSAPDTPQAAGTEPFCAVPTRPARVPDKPPRA